MPARPASPADAAGPDDIDLHDPAFARDPYPAYQHLREHCPLAHSSQYGGFWLLTRYADVRAAALDWRSYTSSVAGVTAIPVITHRTKPQLPIEIDPPLHSRYRAIMASSFTPARIAQLRPRVSAIADELLAALTARGGGDLITDYATPLSVRTLAALTDLPLADAPRWVDWIRRMFDVRDREDGARASAEFGAYIDTLIQRSRVAPADDFLGALMRESVDGIRLTDDELHAYMTVLFGAGFETTADAIGVALHWLAQHPEQRRAVLGDAEAHPRAVEEFLRLATPVQSFGRNATRELSLHGRTVCAGDIVALCFGAANRDPEQFEAPDEFRPDRGASRHLAFGAGPHLCLGAPVARLELLVTLEAFARHAPEWRISGEAAWKTRGDRRGLARLPVAFG